MNEGSGGGGGYYRCFAGGYGGWKEQKLSLPIGTKFFLHTNFAKTFLSFFFFGTDMAASSRGRKSSVPVNLQKSEAHRFHLYYVTLKDQ